MGLLKKSKIGFIGAGNMAQAMIRAYLDSGTIDASRIFVSSRTDQRVRRVTEKLGVRGCASNEELVDSTDVVFLAMKPQDLMPAVEPIAMTFAQEHSVLSVAAGVPLKTLERTLPQVGRIARVMPNLPVRIRRGVVGLCTSEKNEAAEEDFRELLSPLGEVVTLKEGEQLEALAVAASGGPGFIFELMQYWQDWIEGYGIDEETARRITVQTFVGAALLAETQLRTSLDELQSQVVSKKGITAAGLQSMRELEIERLLRYSFEKAVLRDRELGDRA